MKKEIDKIAKNLEKGGILVHGTDTCFGFATFFDNEKGIINILKIKGRIEDKPFSLLFSSLQQAKKYVKINLEQEKFINLHKNKSSFILNKKEILQNYFPDFKNVSIRIENENFLLKPAFLFGKPLTSTSVNISGEKNLNTEKDILEVFGKYDFIDFIFPKKNALDGTASSIWDLSGNHFRKIR